MTEKTATEMVQNVAARSGPCGSVPAQSVPKLGLDIFYQVSAYLDDRDLAQLSRTCKDMSDMLRHRLAGREAPWVNENWVSWASKRDISPISLSLAIANGRPLDIINKIVSGYMSAYDKSAGYYFLRGWPGGSREPTPMHLAASLNRIDVVELLLNYGVPINLRSADSSHRCYPMPHAPGILPHEFRNSVFECKADCGGKTILDIAKEAGNDKLISFLFTKGVGPLLYGGVRCRGY